MAPLFSGLIVVVCEKRGKEQLSCYSRVRGSRSVAEMAEIALLMAEEYERAQKWRKEAPAEVPVCVFFSYLPNLRKKADGVSSPPVAKLEVRARKAICAGQAAESKTSSFGLAAMEGFFPA